VTIENNYFASNPNFLIKATGLNDHASSQYPQIYYLTVIDESRKLWMITKNLNLMKL